SLLVTGGMVLNGTLNIGSADGSIASSVYFGGTGTLSGSGQVVFGNSINNELNAGTPSGFGGVTLTIASGISIHGGSGSLNGADFQTDTIINQAQIVIPSGQSLTIGADSLNWTNNGSIVVT